HAVLHRGAAAGVVRRGHRPRGGARLGGRRARARRAAALLMAAIAVVTRTKDRVLLLRRCIETVLNQGFADWVHVIVNDGGAPDEVEALAAEYRDRYGDRLILIHNAESRGMEAAANIGVAASSSEFVAVLDDDDTWDPAFLATCIAALRAETYPGTRGIICRTDIIYERISGTEIRKVRQFGYNADMVAV